MQTHIRPMTNVCGLPPGWQLVRDASGKLFYRDAAGQVTTQHPNGLPPGWQEAKDPDGKMFYVNNQLQLASWHRPDEQPSLGNLPTLGMKLDSVSQQPSVAPRPQMNRIQTAPQTAPQPAVQPAATIQRPQTTVALQSTQPLSRPTLRTATEATVNLLDPSHGAVLRQSRIAGHIAGQSIIGSVNAIKRNKPLQDFAKGTGIALANKKIKRAWRKAAADVDAAYGSGRTKVEIKVNTAPTGSTPGQTGTIEEVDDGYNGDYEVEFDDGTIVLYSADGKPLRVVTRSQPSSSISSPIGSPVPPQLSRVSTASSVDQAGRRASVPIRRSVGQTPQQQQQQQQMMNLKAQQQQIQMQQQELQRQMLAQAQLQNGANQQMATQTIIADPTYIVSQPVVPSYSVDVSQGVLPQQVPDFGAAANLATAQIIADPNGVANSIIDPSQYAGDQGDLGLADGVDTLSIGGDSTALSGSGVFDMF